MAASRQCAKASSSLRKRRSSSPSIRSTLGCRSAVVHVAATAGRVVPALRADAENGSIPVGVDWLPRTTAPATTQTVPGILGDAGSRQLVVGNPGTLDATYSLTA